MRAAAAGPLGRLTALYFVASATMLVINKVALHFVPAAPVVLLCQLAACVAASAACCCGACWQRGGGPGGAEGGGRPGGALSPLDWRPHAAMAALFLAATGAGLKVCHVAACWPVHTLPRAFSA